MELTGEPQAENFILSGLVDLDQQSTILFFSDGFTPLVEHADFANHLIQGIDSLKDWDAEMSKTNYRFGHERTLLIVKNE